MLSLLITADRPFMPSRLVTCYPGQGSQAHNKQNHQDDKDIEGLRTQKTRSEMTTYHNFSNLSPKNTIHHFSILNSHVLRLHTTFIHVFLDFFLSFPLCQVEWVLSQRIHVTLVITHVPSSSTSVPD